MRLPTLDTPTEAVSVLVAALGYLEFPQVSPDGQTVLFNIVHDYATSQLFQVSSRGGQVRALFTGQTVDKAGLPAFFQKCLGKIDEQASWSHDGRRLFYRTNQKGTFALGCYDCKRREAKVLAHDASLNMKHPIELSDGQVVCYGGPPDATHTTVDQYSNLFLVDPETGQSRLLTHSKGEVAYKHPAEMKGKIVAHKEFKGEGAAPAELVLIDRATGSERNLSQSSDMDERHPFYNQKRDLLVYHRRDAAGDKNLVLSTPDGARCVQLTFYGAPAQSPCWSTDGKKLYFVKKLTKPPGLKHFYERESDLRVLDVPQALKTLHKQSKQQLKWLKQGRATERLLACAQARVDDYDFFLERY